MITDFATGRKVNIEALQRMLGYSSEAEHFTMRDFFVEISCGTAGCHLGTYCLRENKHSYTELFRIELPSAFENFSMQEFNISSMEHKFLFTNHKRQDWCKDTSQLENPSSDDAALLDQKQACARLKKFIMWKIRKSKLLDNLELARTKEGNWNFVLEVLNAIAI